MDLYIEQAKVMSKGQITLPLEIRKLLGVKSGDRVSFIVNGNTIIIANSAICALKILQSKMQGKAEKVGLLNDEDVQAYLEENEALE